MSSRCRVSFWRLLAQLTGLTALTSLALGGWGGWREIQHHGYLDLSYFRSSAIVLTRHGNQALLDAGLLLPWIVAFSLLLVTLARNPPADIGREAAGRPLTALAIASSVAGAIWLVVHTALANGWEDFRFLSPCHRLLAGASLPLLLLATFVLLHPQLRSRGAQGAVRLHRLCGLWPVALAAVAAAPLAALHTGLAYDRRAARPRGPNAILIVVDTLRADHVGLWGYTRLTTPRIDAFARQAHVYRHAVATAPWTSPSVAGMLTSRYPKELGFSAWAVDLDPSLVMLAEVFREHNYRTAAIVSNPHLSDIAGFGQGFERYDTETAGGRGHISSASVSDKGIAFVEQSRDEPFFLFLHYMDPHYDYLLHPDYDFDRDYCGIASSLSDWDELVRLADELSADDIEHLVALYDSEIRFTDEHLERFLARLVDLDLYDDSLIVLTADHGEEFADHGPGRMGHRHSLYQEVLHVPLLIKDPGSTEGRASDRFVSLVDLAPTILARAGLRPPGDGSFRGTPLSTEDDERAVVSELPAPLYALESVIDGRSKLIRDRRTGERQLFDLAEDPGERRNLVEARPQLLARLESILDRHGRSVNSQATAGAAPLFSEEQRQQLRSLGYVDD